jgi:anti-sigma regulatory factor (Ser/Thr protein kinase)
MASVNQRALPDAVPAIRAAISDFLDGLGVPESQSADIKLAVSEAATNVVRHAYPGPPVGDIRCDGSAVDGTIVVSVCDWGRPFSAPTPDPGLGMGNPVMETLAAGVVRSHIDGMKQVELTFIRR